MGSKEKGKGTDVKEEDKSMDVKEFVKNMQEMNKQCTEEDKQMLEQLKEKENAFDKENKLTVSDFNDLYGESTKNFNLDFGTVCEKGRDEVIDNMAKAKNLWEKQKVAKEYLACVELTRQKASQRAQQD